MLIVINYNNRDSAVLRERKSAAVKDMNDILNENAQCDWTISWTKKYSS